MSDARAIYEGTLNISQLGMHNPNNVSRIPTGIYCYMSDGLSRKISGLLVIVASISIIVFEGNWHNRPWSSLAHSVLYPGLTFLMLYKNPSTLHHLRSSANNDVSFAMIMRVSVFSVLPMIALA